jgi:hypothetical protein
MIAMAINPTTRARKTMINGSKSLLIVAAILSTCSS